MKNIFLFLAICLPSTLIGMNAPLADKCSHSTPCVIGERSYHVLPPDRWDGKTPLPVLIHFHGWGRQGTVPIQHAHIGKATRKHGVLLVAPNGLGKSWSFWQAGSRDTKFVSEIIADIEKHYPIDQSKLMISGYSWGASMAWRFSCEAGNKVWVLLSISGTLYDQNETCDTGPVTVRHVHGTKDTVMDFPYGANGDRTGPVALWLRHNGCGQVTPSRSAWSTSQAFDRYSWENCTTSKNVTLDVHEGGHWIARGWLARQFEQLGLSEDQN